MELKGAEHDALMTTTEARPLAAPAPQRAPGRRVVEVITTTDQKVIGHVYVVTSFAFFLSAVRWR